MFLVALPGCSFATKTFVCLFVLFLFFYLFVCLFVFPRNSLQH